MNTELIDDNQAKKTSLILIEHGERSRRNLKHFPRADVLISGKRGTAANLNSTSRDLFFLLLISPLSLHTKKKMDMDAINSEFCDFY